MERVPRSVRVVTVIAWVAGILNILGGLFLLIVAGASTEGLVKGSFLLFGALGIGFGLALVFVTGGLPGASRGARIGVTVIAAVTIMPAVLAALITQSVAGALTAVLAALVIVLLWAGPARTHFRRREPRPLPVDATAEPAPLPGR
ncbi:MAG: hypothetical protein JWN36_1526 [Microbacteriaceae bacterium]|nr:hypothetical protein [Microbacteriaceae bacterium]